MPSPRHQEYTLMLNYAHTAVSSESSDEVVRRNMLLLRQSRLRTDDWFVVLLGCGQQASIWLVKSRRAWNGEALATTNKIKGRHKRIIEAFLMVCANIHSFCSELLLTLRSSVSDAVPEELVEPLYRDQYNQEHLKPTVASLLQSAELYCRAGSLILRSDAVKPLLGHNAVIQALAQKGLYVTDQDRLVTERDLTSMPIHMVSRCLHNTEASSWNQEILLKPTN